MPPKLVPALICSDLARSRAFYCDVLGFTVCYERPHERFVYFDRDGAELCGSTRPPPHPHAGAPDRANVAR